MRVSSMGGIRGGNRLAFKSVMAEVLRSGTRSGNTGSEHGAGTKDGEATYPVGQSWGTHQNLSGRRLELQHEQVDGCSKT